MPGIAERILQFNLHRDPEKVLLKYAAMRESSFRFFRGTCHLYYEDINAGTAPPASPAAWLCGDLHMENFGSFKGSDREVYFDINDFDEAALAPALYELSRLLVSVLLACCHASCKKSYRQQLLDTVLNSYSDTLQKGKPVTVEDGTATGPVKILLDNVSQRKEKKLVKEKTGKSSAYSNLITDNKKEFVVEESLKKQLIKALQARLDETRGKNKREIHDVVFAVAGTGSIGISRYIALASDTGTGKKYLLTIKQALPSSLNPFNTIKQPAWQNEAERIIQAQYRMQHVTPGGLGSVFFNNDWYIIKWIQPEADKISLASFLSEEKEQLVLMKTLGSLTASAQLRSSGRDGSAIADELIRFGKKNDWQKPLLDFTWMYADQAEKDFVEYCRDYDKGFFKTSTFKK